MSTPDRGYKGEPAVSCLFLLEVDGVEIGMFSEVSGLEASIGVEEYQEGGENGFAHKLPGRMSWPNIVFRRGVTANDALFEWFNRASGEGFAAASNKLSRCTGAITMLSGDYQRLRSWNLRDAFPVKWSGPTFSASKVEALQESLEVAHHGFVSNTP